MDDFGLVKSVDHFGDSVFVVVADASRERPDACLCQTLGIENGRVLGVAVGMVNQPATESTSRTMNYLIEDIEDKTRRGSSVCPPTDGMVGKSIDRKF